MQKRKSIHISIPNPCGLAWDAMEDTRDGKYCTHCSKCVTDFTTYTDAQLYRFFNGNTDHVCGRFLATQLDRTIPVPPQPHSQLYSLFIALGLSVVIVGGSTDATARRLPPVSVNNPFYTYDQEQSGTGNISGKVIDDRKEPMIGAVIIASQNGITKSGSVSDEDGNFKIKQLTPGVYDIEVRYQSYKTNIMQQVAVTEDRATDVNVCMELDPKAISESYIIGYRIPLIDPFQK